MVIEPTFGSFRERARELLASGVPPADVIWDDGLGAPSLFGAVGTSAPRSDTSGARPLPRVTVPAAFVARAETAALHRSVGRWDLLYRIVYRLGHGEPELLEIAHDPDITRMTRLVADVKSDEHRMHAFLRFRRVPTEHDEPESFVAWYEPDHDIVAMAAPHFARRYPSMRWVILTSGRSAIWDGTSLRFGPGAPRDAAPSSDDLEDLFRAYYSAIFNPARTNVALFERHVPPRFQAAMPEIIEVRELVALAPSRANAMQNKKISPSLAFVPTRPAHDDLVKAAKGCTACHLHEQATQTVFGEGPTRAPLMLVGEQPGDQEDQQGHPFVGPAGRVLDAALEDAGIPRDEVYVTNAVKHFKWEPRGKRRIHSKPNAMEVHACNGWLQAEIDMVKPEVIVCLGATAAQSFMGRAFKITQSRGQLLELPAHTTATAGANGAKLVATYHPSALLRMMRDEELYTKAKGEFIDDLRSAAALVTLGKKKRAAAR